jgi:hypothetical protein
MLNWGGLLPGECAGQDRDERDQDGSRSEHVVPGMRGNVVVLSPYDNAGSCDARYVPARCWATCALGAAPRRPAAPTPPLLLAGVTRVTVLTSECG